jgi:hypothetical protein
VGCQSGNQRDYLRALDAVRFCCCCLCSLFLTSPGAVIGVSCA